MSLQLLSRFVSARGLTAFAALALAGGSAQAQIVYDDFNDGDTSDIGSFSGGTANIGAGVGPTTGITGTDGTGLNLGINPGDGGGFAGAVIPGGDGVTDISGQKYFSFYVRPSLNADNLPMTLEVNFQEDVDGDGAFNPAVEDEYQAVFRLNSDATYQFVQIPIASFADDNTAGAGSDDGFDFTKVLQVVYAVGGIQGSPFAISFDELQFTQEAATLSGDFVSFDDFNDGEVSNTGGFAGGAENTGAGTGPTTGITGTDATGLNLGVDPGTGGGFAGAFITAPNAPFDATGQTYFSFYVRPSLNADNLPMTLEVNFQEDVDGDGAFNPAVEDEYQAVFRLNSDATYQFVQIPIASFADDNTAGAGSDDGFDFSKILNVVYAVGGLQGSPFAISFDELGFTSGGPMTTAGEALPETFVAAPSVYPNPASGAATVAFELAEASDVSVDVVDLLGRTVATLAKGPQAAGSVRMDIPTSTLAAGLYLVRVQTETGVVSTRFTVTR